MTSTLRIQIRALGPGPRSASGNFLRATPVVQRSPGSASVAPRSVARGLENTIARQAQFQRRVIGRHHADRYRALRLLYRLHAFPRVLGWIWAGSRAEGDEAMQPERQFCCGASGLRTGAIAPNADRGQVAIR